MDFDNLHQILRSLYGEMMPLCEDMAGVARGIAGLGARIKKKISHSNTTKRRNAKHFSFSSKKSHI